MGVADTERCDSVIYLLWAGLLTLALLAFLRFLEQVWEWSTPEGETAEHADVYVRTQPHWRRNGGS